MSSDSMVPSASDVARELAAMLDARKDVADVEGILRVQYGRLDLAWVSHWLVELYGPRDPRVAQWNELLAELE